MNTTKTDIHKKGVLFAAMQLIEHGIVTRAGPGNGIDLILNDGRTILVRSMSKESAMAVGGGQSLKALKASYIVIVSNLGYTSLKNIYMMHTDVAKHISENSPYKSTGEDNYFIEPQLYIPHRNKYDIFQ